MIISTEFGNFGNFKDLRLYMDDEKQDYVFVDSCDYWGIECIIPKNGIRLSYQDILSVEKGEF